MKSLSFLLLLAVTVGQLGCSMTDTAEQRLATGRAAPPQGALPAAETNPATKTYNEQPIQPVSLTLADSAETVAAAAERKIIKNGELTLEVASPHEAQRSVSTIAEQHGGFVVTSETKQTENRDPERRAVEVKLIVRVPSSKFDSAVTSIEKLATNVIHRGIAGNDVTEEFIDLEARIRTQKALELQFIEIMKQARQISDALEVQRQIAGVRTEIEKLEGRKRFLENRSSLSTITVELKSPVLIAVNTSGFGRNLRESVSESIGIASAITLGLTRFVILMTPIFIMIVLPLGLVASILIRKAKRTRMAQELNLASGE